jgi:hypothetical protein
MKHEFQCADDAIKAVEARTGGKFSLLPCSRCGHHANLCDPEKDPDSWGGSTDGKLCVLARTVAPAFASSPMAGLSKWICS